MNLATTEIFKNIQVDPAKYILLDGELLKRYQKCILSIADDMISVFEDEGINYQLSGGSALGAIREHGFIPWDDDIDINMFSEDFEKFSNAFLERFGDRYWLSTWKADDCAATIARVRKKGTIIRTRDDIGNSESGFFVDIFFFENVPDNIILRYLHGFLCLSIGLLTSCRGFYQRRALMRDFERDNPEIRKTFETKIFIGRLCSFMPLNRWAILMHHVYGLCKNSHSKYVNIPAGRGHYFGEMYLREDMENTVKMPFEGHEWNVARNYDAYFKALYGPDYMTPPPPEKREKHVVLELKFPEDREIDKKQVNNVEKSIGGGGYRLIGSARILLCAATVFRIETEAAA